MVLIKRYPNRKLYDTVAKQYVSLDSLAELIRHGDVVQVLDHATGEDITSLVLMQVIVELEKRQTGFLPSALVSGLVQAGGHTLASLRRALEAPLGWVQVVDEEIARRIAGLVELGELAEEEGLRLLEALVEGVPDRMAVPEVERLGEFIESRGVPSRADVRALDRALDRLAEEVEKLGHKAEPGNEGEWRSGDT